MDTLRDNANYKQALGKLELLPEEAQKHLVVDEGFSASFFGKLDSEFCHILPAVLEKESQR